MGEFVIGTFFTLLGLISLVSLYFLFFKINKCDHEFDEWKARERDLGSAESYYAEVARFCNKCNHMESYNANDIYSFHDLIKKAKEGEL